MMGLAVTILPGIVHHTAPASLNTGRKGTKKREVKRHKLKLQADLPAIQDK